jgi:hypothetical protein
MLTQERLKTLITYNPDTGEIIRKSSGKLITTKDAYGYVVVNIDGKNYKGHRLAYLYMLGKWPSNTIDHVNTIRADNKWKNIREASMAEQSHNQTKSKNNISGVKGVHYMARNRLPYAASIQKDWQRITKCFATMEEAVIWLDNKRIELHKEFSHTGDCR